MVPFGFVILMLTATLIHASPSKDLKKEHREVEGNAYYTQDGQGQYKYGYSDGHSSKEEIRSLDGKTRGSYSYMDPNGQLQAVSYIADAENGFKIISDTLQPSKAISVEGQRAETQKRIGSETTTPSNEVLKTNSDTSEIVPSLTQDSSQKTIESFSAKDPLIDPSRQDMPEDRVHPFSGSNVVPMVYGFYPFYLQTGYYRVFGPSFGNLRSAMDYSNNQYAMQDNRGQYMYEYSNLDSAKREMRRADGVTIGSYSYYDSNGQLQSVAYSADAENGFRVMATNLPIGPVAVPLQNLI